jgi:hypothetical protein
MMRGCPHIQRDACTGPMRDCSSAAVVSTMGRYEPVRIGPAQLLLAHAYRSTSNFGPMRELTEDHMCRSGLLEAYRQRMASSH